MRNLISGCKGISLGVLALALAGGGSLASAQEYAPDSPKVKSMVDKGLKYIESRLEFPFAVGYKCMMGYTVYKATDNPDHPWVKKALEEAEQITADSLGGSQVSAAEKSDEYLYAVSVAIQLMVAVDPIKYAPQLQTLLDYLERRQRPDGSFGYKYKDGYAQTGDTSQTQYGLLALWSLNHAQIEVPHEMVEKALVWLRDNQRPDGGFTYQAPDNSYNPNHVMTAVGMSATMIAGDILEILRPGGGSAMAALEGQEADQDVGVPAAFRRVVDDPTKKLASNLNQATVSTVASKADKWINSKPYQRASYGWHYYYLYSVERYQAFLEAMHGRREKNPKWYQDLAEQLAGAQSADGAWGQKDPDAGSMETSTCFAMLVLMRATQKSIGELNEAVLFGGQGLKADMSSVDFSSGKVEDKKELTDIDAALAMLENEKFGKDVSADLARRIRLDSDPKKRNEQLDRFARLLRSDTAVSRRVAARILCRGDNLDMVPHLIYALSDPDGATNINAENSLRVLSRQMNTYKIPQKLEQDKLEFPMQVRIAAQEYWKKWFLSVRPDFIFLENN